MIALRLKFALLFCVVCLLVFLLSCCSAIPGTKSGAQESQTAEAASAEPSIDVPSEAEEKTEYIASDPERKPLSAYEETFSKTTTVSEQKESRSLLFADGYKISVYESEEKKDGYLMKTRRYVCVDGSSVDCFRAEGSGSTVSFPLPSVSSTEGKVLQYDYSLSCWKEAPLLDGFYCANVLLLELENHSQFLLYMPKSYTRLENSVICHEQALNGSLRVSRQDQCLTLEADGLLPESGGFCDFLAIYLPNGGMDANSVNSCAYAFEQYAKDGDAKWCFDGYWRFTPYNYIPTGENCYYRCAASYLAACMVKCIGNCPAAPLLSAAMLDTTALCQSADGFWPTSPGSQWLSDDYHIGPGFYDTRFNTDLILTYLEFSDLMGTRCFSDTISLYFDFYLTFSAENHVETENGGWLVADYGYRDTHVLPHISLNHQLAEALLLYKAASFLDNPSLSALADCLMQGIDDTNTGWIKEDHDLHYCIFPDGHYGLQDYPYLTYNDMFKMQAYYRSVGHNENETLQTLMAEKKSWMDANGITDYIK